MYEFLPLGSIDCSGISGDFKVLSPASSKIVYSVHQAVGLHTHIHFFSYHLKTKSTTLLQKIVCESNEVIEVIYYANSILLNSKIKLFYFTYYNSSHQRYQTDVIINDTIREKICYSKEYHQLEIISPNGTFLMISKKNRIRILQLKFLKNNTIETTMVKNFGKTLWYQYIPKEMKLVFLASESQNRNENLSYSQSFSKSTNTLEKQAEAEEISSTKSSSLEAHRYSSISRLEAYSLKQVPSTFTQLYKYKIALSYTPTLKYLFPPLLPNQIEPLQHYPRFYNNHMNCQILTLENGSDVLCRHYFHPMEPRKHIKISLILFKNNIKGKISFDLKINAKSSIIMNHITYISQRNIIFIFVSGHYFKAVDFSNYTPISLFTLQYSKELNDIIPRVPIITKFQNSRIELPTLFQLYETNLSEEFFSQALKKGLVSILLNSNDGRLYAMRLSSSEAKRYIIQKQSDASSLIYLSNQHLNNKNLSTTLLKTVFANASIFPIHLIEAIEEYIVSTTYSIASETLKESDILSYIPNSINFSTEDEGEISIYKEISTIMEKYPFGLNEWRPIWLENQEKSHQSKQSSNSHTNQQITLEITDFIYQNTSNSQPNINGFSGFLKSVLQIKTKDDIIRNIQDPYSMSQRWLYFTCLQKVFNERMARLKKKPTNQHIDSPKFTSRPWLSLSWSKSFSIILCEVISDVYNVIKDLKKEILSSESIPDSWYFHLLESLQAAIKEYGFPVPENFSLDFGYEAYKHLPESLFLKYVDRNLILVDTKLIQKIASLENSDPEVIFRLAKNLYYKYLYNPNTKEEQHIEIKKEIAFFQNKKRRKSKKQKEDQNITRTSSSSALSDSSDISEVSETDSIDTNLNPQLTGAILSYYHSYIQASPKSQSNEGSKVFSASPSVSSPLTSKETSSYETPTSSLPITDVAYTPLNSFVAAIVSDPNIYEEQLNSNSDNYTSSAIHVNKKHSAMQSRKFMHPSSNDSRLKDEKLFLAHHVEAFSRDLFDQEKISPIRNTTLFSNRKQTLTNSTIKSITDIDPAILFSPNLNSNKDEEQTLLNRRKMSQNKKSNGIDENVHN